MTYVLKAMSGEKKFLTNSDPEVFFFFLVLIHMSCVIGSLKTGSHILRKSDCTFSLFILDHMFKM